MAKARAEAAAVRLAEVKAELAAERLAHHADVEELKTELAKVGSQIRAEAERLAVDAIVAARAETGAAIRAGKELHDGRVAAVVAALRGPSSPGAALDTHQWIHLADALGVQVGDLVGDAYVSSRADRRVRSGNLANMESLSPDAQAAMRGTALTFRTHRPR
jgi:hypothetical protein